jgi:hypothetical protein
MSSQAARSTGASEPGGDARPAGYRAGDGDGARDGDGAGLAGPETAARMAAAARALHGALTGEQASVLNPGFDDCDLGSPRRPWTYRFDPERYRFRIFGDPGAAGEP